MPSTLPAQLRVWSALASQGHVVPAAGGVMFNAAQEIERMEMLLEAGGARYWENRCLELEAALREISRLTDYDGTGNLIGHMARTALGEKKDG